MNLHEYQSKALFSEYAIPVPAGKMLDSLAAAESEIEQGSGPRVLKAQVHSGGRGKAGGVLVSADKQSLLDAARRLLGKRLVTTQSGAQGVPVEKLLLEPACDIERELYFAVLLDRASERIVMMASSAGGMNIEEVARQTPEKIIRIQIDPAAGLQAWQCRKMGFALQLQGDAFKQLHKIMFALLKLYRETDASLIEINPLVVTRDNQLLAVDAKINIDDNALYRHKNIAALRDIHQEDEREAAARVFDLNYITLDGNIGCMVNGAGLAMATMDLVKLHGGQPANFLDVGGGTTAERVAEAFKLILSDDKVEAVLVNIFGGIVRCDLIAQGIIAAVKDIGIHLPVVVRLEGTNARQGLQLLAQSDLDVLTASDLDSAAEQVVKAAGGAA
ncbi:MAG: ADP-forming succinate--CoA ligase subunit beta [gamma proteobacterium symbiont of Bathyaustriella thionipta]|nr:ADP-forming succinate--CoA ligase subunit beta [gamma proteobacterium symbiont of Bathyaustriella thionipta]